MATTTSCPSCHKALRVPDDLLGRNVKCPSCGEMFVAEEGAGAGPPEEVEERRPDRRPAPPPDDDDDDDFEEEERRPRRRRRRSYLQPHRGQTILVLGILSFFIAGIILGPIAWVMGNNDLREIRAGRMDPEGESNTNAGRICGMIATILNIVALVGCCGYFTIVAALVATAGKMK